jgi:hypothetical protein
MGNIRAYKPLIDQPHIDPTSASQPQLTESGRPDKLETETLRQSGQRREFRIVISLVIICSELVDVLGAVDEECLLLPYPSNAAWYGFRR